MKFKIAVIQLDKENEPNDLVRLAGGAKNCFHIRKRIDGGLKALKPLKAILTDEKGKEVSNAPENVINELVAGRLDIDSEVTPELEYKDLGGNWYTYYDWMKINDFYATRLRPKRNPDGTIVITIDPIVNHRPSR